MILAFSTNMYLQVLVVIRTVELPAVDHPSQFIVRSSEFVSVLLRLKHSSWKTNIADRRMCGTVGGTRLASASNGVVDNGLVIIINQRVVQKRVTHITGRVLNGRS